MRSEDAVIGVLALQGAFREHIQLLLSLSNPPKAIPVRTTAELNKCDGLIIPGGESTTIALIASRTDLLASLRKYVEVDKKPVWGTCAGMILLSDKVLGASAKLGGQELIGGMGIQVVRNQWGRQIESFEHQLNISCIQDSPTPFPGVFIRAPVLHSILEKDLVQVICTVPREALPDPLASSEETNSTTTTSNKHINSLRTDMHLNLLDPAARNVSTPVQSLAPTPSSMSTPVGSRPTSPNLIPLGPDAHIVALRQGKMFVTSFHPELTGDNRIHQWWLEDFVLKST